MATILEQYRKRQNEIREQIAANSLPLDQMLIMQELNYRICVLETFESLCKSAPVTMDTKSMGFHFQLVDAYVRFTLNERKFGPKTDAEGQKKRETALQSFTQVVQDGRKRFSSFNASTQEQYKTCMRYIPAFRATKSAKRFWHEWEYLRMLHARGRKFCRKRIRNAH